MKTKLLLTIALLISLLTFAQQGINYKALIKDTSGSIVADLEIKIQFQILEGVAQTNIYQETHTLFTDSNGLAIVNIGEGVVNSGSFSGINWASDNHFLNVQVNVDGNFVDMGTTQFMAVPYALSAANATGLKQLTENNNTGFRLFNSNPNNYGNIGEDAIDLSINNSASTTRGATGNESIAFGKSTTASGIGATAMGRETEAAGTLTTTMGLGTQSDALFGVAIGTYNIGGGSPNQQLDTNPIFEIGNGVSNLKSNAFTVLHSGLVLAPSLNITEITDSKALITKEYLEANASLATGLEEITEFGNTGWRLVGRNPNNYGDTGNNAVDLSNSIGPSATRGALGDNAFAIGQNTIASGDNSTAMGITTNSAGSASTAMGQQTNATGSRSTAMGFNTIATGIGSTAMGQGTTALGKSSTAMGFNTTAAANNSTAMGEQTNATGFASTAMGFNTTASGNNSTAIGDNTKAEAAISMAIGSYNVGGGNPTSALANDPVFEIGIGTSDTNRQNALTVLKNGTHIIKKASSSVESHIILEGSSNSTLGDDARISTDPNLAGSDLFLRSNDAVVIELDADNNENGQFEIRAGDGSIVFEVRENGNATLAGSLTQNSDKRLKKDIVTIPYGLKEILQLQPKAYNWKSKDQDHKSLGLIAQEVQPIIKNIVNIGNDKEKTLGVSYTELIPVLIKALQEQQDIIDGQKNKINGLSAEVENLKTLENRIKALEHLAELK